MMTVLCRRKVLLKLSLEREIKNQRNPFPKKWEKILFQSEILEEASKGLRPREEDYVEKERELQKNRWGEITETLIWLKILDVASDNTFENITWIRHMSAGVRDEFYSSVPKFKVQRFLFNDFYFVSRKSLTRKCIHAITDTLVATQFCPLLKVSAIHKSHDEITLSFFNVTR